MLSIKKDKSKKERQTAPSMARKTKAGTCDVTDDVSNFLLSISYKKKTWHGEFSVKLKSGGSFHKTLLNLHH